MVGSASPRMANCLDRGVVRSREPFEFWWACVWGMQLVCRLLLFMIQTGSRFLIFYMCTVCFWQFLNCCCRIFQLMSIDSVVIKTGNTIRILKRCKIWFIINFNSSQSITYAVLCWFSQNFAYSLETWLARRLLFLRRVGSSFLMLGMYRFWDFGSFTIAVATFSHAASQKSKQR